MSDKISTEKWIIVAFIFTFLMSYVLKEILSSNFALGMWAGAMLYGMVNNYIGSTELIDDISRNKADYEEYFGFDFDSLLVPQFLYIVISVTVVLAGYIMQSLVGGITSALSDIQMFGAVIVVSRASVSLWSGNSLKVGAWFKSIYTLGLLFILVPHLQRNWIIPESFFWTVVIAILLPLLILGIEHRNAEAESPEDYWIVIKEYVMKFIRFIR